jgi:predicted transcriptional regulator
MLPTKRRRPSQITLELLDCIEEKGEATKWDLLKILGTTWQFHHWIEAFLLKEKFIKERIEKNHYYYTKTPSGIQLHELLRNGKILKAFTKISGKRLRRE